MPSTSAVRGSTPRPIVPSTAPAHPRLALAALALGTFGIGVTEFAVSGLLPGIAGEFDVSVTEAGYLATVYAVGVFVSAPVLGLLGQRFERKRFLLALIAVFVVGNVVTGAAPTFGVALTGRAVTSLAHGAFIGIGSMMAASVVPENKRTSAIAFVFSGLTVANLFGTPVATWVSDAVSWRVPYLGIAGIGLITLVGILAWIPRTSRGAAPAVLTEIRGLAHPQLLLAMVVTVLGPAGFFTSITYIAPITVNVTGTPESWVTLYMAVFGLGLVIGNLVGGRLADLALMPLLLGSLVVQAISLVVFWLAAESVLVAFTAVFVMAASGFATVSPIQRLVMERAETAGAPNLAASMNIGMFNLGNAIGAWLGGATIAAGVGYSSPNLAGAVLAVGAALAALLIIRQSTRCARRRTQGSGSSARSAHR